MPAPASAVVVLANAVFAVLKADPGVLAALGGRPHVFDVVPGGKNTRMPWVALGPVGTKRLENDCHRGWEIRLRIFAATDDFKRDEVWAIADAVDLALDAKTPVLDQSAGYGLCAPLRTDASGDIIDPDKPRSVFLDVIGLVMRKTPLFAGADG